ncbi:MAG: hypothetical protein HOE69_01830, partial [Euryarchaeota archaeon]|nr:hypothetical protein [Euryarchaeota archaeon]
MEFVGKYDRESHEGGILITFIGEAPHLGSALETADGTYLGRVDSVIGRVDAALVHVMPTANGLEINTIGDSDISVQKRRQRDDNRGGHQDSRGGRDHRDGRGNDRGGNRDSRGGRDQRGGRDRNQGANDWDCPKCNNNNFGWRDTCNRCPTKRPSGGGNRGGDRGGNRGGYQGGNRGGD